MAPIALANPPKPRRFTPRWSLAGVAIGCVGYAASLTPTLLPRTNFTQALASSVTAVAGYAIGAISEAVVRAASDRVRRSRSLPPSPQRLSTKWRVVITGGLVVVAAAFTPWAVSAQVEQRAVMQVPG